MKPPRERDRMDRSCVVKGSLAAFVAAICVLGLASPATAEGGRGGFAGPPIDQRRCCGPSPTAAGIADGLAGPAVGGAPAGGRGPGDTLLAQSEATSPRGASEHSQSPDEREKAPPAATESPGSDAKLQDEKIPVTIPEDTAETFKGSVKPAGPDLSPNEERELISRGWE